MLPYSIIDDNDNTPEFACCISERTRQIILAALSNIEDRVAWDEMSDNDWDITDASIGDAVNEILATDACP